MNTDHRRATQNLRVGCQRNSEGTKPDPSDKVPERCVKFIEETMLRGKRVIFSTRSCGVGLRGLVSSEVDVSLLQERGALGAEL